jgi:sortase A
LEGSSLPGGGKGTHTVLSGHRGLPSATLFTNLDQLELGDVFYVHVLNRTLTYMVDDISIVLPYEVDQLTIDPEQDYVTLVTCTPYGVNSHRLLVRGTRVDTDNGFDSSTQYTFHIYKDAEVYSINVIAPIAAVPLFILVLIYILVRYRNKKSS